MAHDKVVTGWEPAPQFTCSTSTKVQILTKYKYCLSTNTDAHEKVVTGWVLEGATWVKGEYWREGDWEPIDTHVNDTSFHELAVQAEADGSAGGYLSLLVLLVQMYKY